MYVMHIFVVAGTICKTDVQNFVCYIEMHLPTLHARTSHTHGYSSSICRNKHAASHSVMILFLDPNSKRYPKSTL